MEKQEFTEGQTHEAMIRLRGMGLTPKGLQRLIEDKEKAESVVALLEEKDEEKDEISTKAFKIAKNKIEEKKRKEAEHKRKKYEKRKARAIETLSRCQPILEHLRKIESKEDFQEFLNASPGPYETAITVANKGRPCMGECGIASVEVRFESSSTGKHLCFVDYSGKGYFHKPLTKEVLESYAEDWARKKNRGGVLKVLQKLTQEQVRKRITKKLKKCLGKDYKEELISI